MKFETILNALIIIVSDIGMLDKSEVSQIVFPKFWHRIRQRDAFRARLVKMYSSKYTRGFVAGSGINIPQGAADKRGMERRGESA